MGSKVGIVPSRRLPSSALSGSKKRKKKKSRLVILDESRTSIQFLKTSQGNEREGKGSSKEVVAQDTGGG